MSFVMYHMSHITCRISHVLCHMSLFFYFFIYFFLFIYFSRQIGGASWWRVCYQLSVELSCGLSELWKLGFHYLVPGTLAYCHILLCHHGDSKIHQTTDIANFFWFSFILITLSSAITILLSSSLSGNPPLSHTFATSSTTCFAFIDFCVVLCHSSLLFLNSVRYI